MFPPDDPYSQEPLYNPYDQKTLNQQFPQYDQRMLNQQYSPYTFQGRNRAGNQFNRNRRQRITGGCLLLLLIAAIPITAFVFAFIHFQNQPPDFFYQGDVINVQTLLIPGIIIAGVLILLGALARAFRRFPPGKAIGGLFIVAIVALIGVSVLWGGLINPNIGMTRSGFIRSYVNITSGDTIHIRNPSDGVTQILCVGLDQQCMAGVGDPVQLDQGLTIQPGQTVSVTFDTDGNYQITSKTTPHMNVIINVSESDDDGGD